MRFLVDAGRARIDALVRRWPQGVCGQLLTPLTGYRLCAHTFAIDNGSFSGFDLKRFRAVLARSAAHVDRCLFVAAPDVVGDHQQTLELWKEWHPQLLGWPLAFVAQDGFAGIPDGARALFIGGSDAFKNSGEAADAVRTALAAGLHVHIGRVNSAQRYTRFRALGAHTCDGSGFSRYDAVVRRVLISSKQQSLGIGGLS